MVSEGNPARIEGETVRNVVSLDDAIKAHWEKYSVENFDESSVAARKLYHPENRDLFFALQFSPEREAFLRKKKYLLDPGNPFATTLGKKDNIRIPRFIVSKNLFPWQKYQVIIISETEKKLFDGPDLVSLLNFSRKTGYEIIYNMEGSGASAITHCHFQGFIDPFPVNVSPVAPFDAVRRVELSRLTFPAYGIRFAGPAEDVSRVAVAFLKVLPCPYNLLISKGMIFVVPRLKAIPEGFGEWDFGGAEVSGLFFPRSLEQFHKLSFHTLRTALLDTTFCDPEDWAELEDVAHRAALGGKSSPGTL